MLSSEYGSRAREENIEADSARAVAVGSAVVVALTTLVAALFLPHQALWIDESTQLSGLSLSPPDLVHWLAHPDAHDFGVPPDRMPPLSYWLGWMWSRVMGLDESSMRWFGVLCAAGASALVFSAARRAFGLRAGLFAGLFFALSSNVCVTAVEIRAYPLFLLTSSGAVRALVVILRAPASDRRRGMWIALAAWLTAGIYTHFFGALFAAAVVFLLAVDQARGRGRLRPVVVLAAAITIAMGGLVPFVIASTGLSGGANRDRTREVVQLVYRLVGHPALSVYPLATALTFGAAGALLVAGWLLPAGPRRQFRFLAAVLIVGIATSCVANFLPLGFTAAKVSYSTWALPLTSVVLAAGLAQPLRRWSRMVLVMAAVFCVCQAVGISQLAWRGDYFAHGPQRHLQQILDVLRPQRPAVIHADPTGDYAAAYFPLRFVNGPGLAQFVVAESGNQTPLGIPLDLTKADWRGRLASYSHLVVVRSRVQSARQLADQIRHGDHAFGENGLISTLESSGEWRRLQHELYVSFVAADVTVLQSSGGIAP